MRSATELSRLTWPETPVSAQLRMAFERSLTPMAMIFIRAFRLTTFLIVDRA
jgi:hypothetical protein